MSLDFLILDGYGQFVWPAFLFTFACCFFLYLKTKKEFLKQEEMFLNEFNQLQAIKLRVAEKKEATKEALPSSSI